MKKHRTLVVSLLALFAFTVPMAAQLASRDGVHQNGRPNALPEGTTFMVRLEDDLDTKKVKLGKKFKAKLMEDLVASDGSVIPRGKKIKGHVSDVERGYRARLVLSFDEIDTREDWVPLVATVVDVPGEHGVSRPGPEGEIERKAADKKRMAQRAAIGAGVGAVTGAAVGGSKGAIIGAAVGAGAGLGSSLLTGGDLKLEDGQHLELRLDRPLAIPAR